MRALVAISLLISLALYLVQVIVYTTDQEALIYSAFGSLWFLAMYLNAFSAHVRTKNTGIFILSGLAALGLGFVPHRLRLGPEFDIYIVLFPMIHFLSTFAFLLGRREMVTARLAR